MKTLICAWVCVLAFGCSCIAQTKLEICVAEEQPATGLVRATVSQSGRTVYLQEPPLLTNVDVTDAHVVPWTSGRFNISVTFTPQAAAKLASATQAHIGRPMAIVVNGSVVSAPRVDGVIRGDAVLTGDWTKQEADEIVAALTGK